ncbi:MAG: hypothetical protein WCK02_16610 [Bacteroidota bacterium]
MARLTGGINFEGSMDNFSAYKRRDMDVIILRRKGGASKKQIQTSDSFVNTRKLNVEWAGCSMAGKAIRNAIHPLKHLADYNISGFLNAIAKTIQKQDIVSEYGKRNICFSKYRDALDGFSLNKTQLFDSVFRGSFTYEFFKDTVSAKIDFSSIWPTIHLSNVRKYPMFRFIACLGIVSDFQYNENLEAYQPVNIENSSKYCTLNSEWFYVPKMVEAFSLELNFDVLPILTDSDSLILGIGIEFGNSIGTQIVEPIKCSGSGKILRVN